MCCKLIAESLLLCPAPAVLLAHVAAHTRQIKLAPATVLLPCNHPLRVAEVMPHL